MEKVQVENVKKIFFSRNKQVIALKDISFTVGKNEFITIVGPSGCGKTTLLRIIAGLIPPTMGEIKILREDPEKPLTAMVFQEQSVFPWLTVYENVEYGLKLRKLPKKLRQEKVEYYLKVTGLLDFARAYPKELSGGMKQRVAVARAFAVEPEVLLLDEPFGALDEQTRQVLQQELLKIWEEKKITSLFITHSIDEAIFLGDKVLVLSARPGTVKAILEVNLPRPRDLIAVRKSDEYKVLFEKIFTLLRN
ncbi:mannosyltransferase [Carboxydothermus islandicus]|uniref:Mannosyltransferase n=1 Tax=Carboxydothermus islandicus TaxID=661089 RepID=A0A1L8D1X2_9THEO|nr:ABC transporter ATP-binding protein [Carboxydothermus islandicus]GAV25149.1 mannosyltransferase [Carboxydothermus islandicus]